MRAGLALAFSFVALLALVASATAQPRSPTNSVPGSFAPITLEVSGGFSAARMPEPGSPIPAGTPPPALVEPGSPPAPTLSPRRQPAVAVRVLVKPTPTPKPRPKPVAPRARSGSVRGASSSGSSLRGAASWYCNRDGSRGPRSSCHYRYPDTAGFDAYAAAGPRLRAALGGGERWRGRVVLVDGIAVKLVDWCQCYQGERNEKVIDLYLDVYRRVGGTVTIRW